MLIPKSLIEFDVTHLTFLGGVLGAIVTISFGWFTSWLRRPIIELIFDENNGGIRDSSWKNENGDTIDSKFVRISIINSGKTSISNATIYLYDIYKIDGEALSKTLFLDPKILSWSSAKSNYSPRNIPPKVKMSADIVSFENNKNWIFRTEDFFSSESTVKKFNGTYCIHILATSENAKPKDMYLNITYKGDRQAVNVMKSTKELQKRIKKINTIK